MTNRRRVRRDRRIQESWGSKSPTRYHPSTDKIRMIIIHILFWPMFVFIAILALFGGGSFGSSEMNSRGARWGDGGGGDGHD